MERRGIARLATVLVTVWLTVMSVACLTAPALAQGVSAHRRADLPAPTNFKVAPAGDHIALTWDAVPGAASYTIYRGTSSHTETLYKAGITSALFDNTSHITKGAIYYYQVAAVDNNGVEGARSVEGASSTDTAVAVNAPGTSHGTAPTAKAGGSGTVWWVLLGVVSLALLGTGVFLFMRQRQQMTPSMEFNADVPQQSGVFMAPPPPPSMMTNPRAVAESFPPREWNEMSPSERAGVSGIFNPPPPEEENYGRQFGAVAFWDDPSEQGGAAPPPPRPSGNTDRHQWTYPQSPNWQPPER